MEKEQTGKGDVLFLQKCFLKLILNFVWWVNRVDTHGLNVFEGGFLGLDNIMNVDRSDEIESGLTLHQSDGTGWMGMFSLNLMRMALELAKAGFEGYVGLCTKFFEHFIYIAHAMKRVDNQRYELWSKTDGFYYDTLSFPDGSFSKFRIRSLVGIIPLFANEIITDEELHALPKFNKEFQWFLKKRSYLVADCVFPMEGGFSLSLVNKEQLESVLTYVWDPNEFRSEYGLRSLSKFHQNHPFFYKHLHIGYEPGYALTKIKGGNSNWRGPVWVQMNYFLIRTLRQYSKIYGEELIISAPDEQGVFLEEMAQKYCERVLNIFLPDEHGIRPFRGKDYPFATDPYWEPYLLFNEYFNAETGQGMGASHQGWTTLIANLIHEKYSH